LPAFDMLAGGRWRDDEERKHDGKGPGAESHR
jgi:hypothetical protein